MPTEQIALAVARNVEIIALVASPVALVGLLLLWRRSVLFNRLSAECENLRAKVGDMHALREELAVARTRAEEVSPLRARVAQLQEDRDAERSHRIALGAQLKGFEANHRDRLQEIATLKKELEDRFSSLASGVLARNSSSFLELVTERFEKHTLSAREDLEKRQKSVADLVGPLGERLTKFDRRVEEIEKARNESYGALNAQIRALMQGQTQLSSQTAKLVQALRAPKTRGRWGEMQMRQVFEMAGMSEHVDFMLERSRDTDRGRQRPDAVVNIPGGRSIVVDAKTPLDAYLNAIEADTPEQQSAHLAHHARQLRAHVKLLSSKAYQDAIETTPDFVILFIPGETFFSAAAEADPELLEYAFRNKILIATPTTLMAILKAVAYGWQQDRMARNTREVQKIAQELYERLGTFADHLGRVGSTLNQSVSAYNKAVGSIESRVLPSARKFRQLGVVPESRELPPPGQVETHARPLTAPEFGPEPRPGSGSEAHPAFGPGSEPEFASGRGPAPVSGDTGDPGDPG